MSVWAWILLPLGGGFGAWARFHADQWLAPRWKQLLSRGPAWSRQISPGMAILTINVVGSFAAGALSASYWMTPSLWLVIGTGVLGGWTTFSTASMDIFNALASAQPGAAEGGREVPTPTRILAAITLGALGFVACLVAAIGGVALAR